MTKLQANELTRIEEAVRRELGPSASEDRIKEVIAEVVDELERGAPTITLNEDANGAEGGRIFITAFGKNKPGILYHITKAAHEFNCDIQDVSQKIMQEFFTMMMIVDITHAKTDFNGLKKHMNAVSEEINIRIYVQHEDIFKSMHRI